MKTQVSIVTVMIIMIMSFSFPNNVFGQEEKSNDSFKMSYIDVNSGKGPIGAGFYVTFGMNSKKSVMQVTITEDKTFVNYFFKISKKQSVKIGPSVGYYQNVPLVGAIASWTPSKYFSTFHWVGWTFGQPMGKISSSPSFLFACNSANIDVWKVRVSYSIVHFQKCVPKHVTCIKYTQKINNNFSVYTDDGYDWTNAIQMIKFGVVYKF